MLILFHKSCTRLKSRLSDAILNRILSRNSQNCKTVRLRCPLMIGFLKRYVVTLWSIILPGQIVNDSFSPVDKMMCFHHIKGLSCYTQKSTMPLNGWLSGRKCTTKRFHDQQSAHLFIRIYICCNVLEIFLCTRTHLMFRVYVYTRVFFSVFRVSHSIWVVNKIRSLVYIVFVYAGCHHCYSLLIWRRFLDVNYRAIVQLSTSNFHNMLKLRLSADWSEETEFHWLFIEVALLKPYRGVH